MIENPQLTYLAQKRHDLFHHPEGLIAKPYLTLPFRQKNLPQINEEAFYNITEGFRYSRAEQHLHGGILHAGIDFAIPYGTPVVAPCDGIAISSYHSILVKDINGTPKKYQNKFLGFGLGYFVQIHVANMDRIVQLGHMSDIYQNIPFSPPVQIDKQGLEWSPTNHQLSVEELSKISQAVPIKRGDLLGWVGYSGMRWGYNDYISNSSRPNSIDRSQNISYDEPHIHLEEARRIPLNTTIEKSRAGQKTNWRDPYDIYLSYRNYPTPIRHRTMGPEPIFIVDKNNLPIFTK